VSDAHYRRLKPVQAQFASAGKGNRWAQAARRVEVRRSERCPVAHQQPSCAQDDQEEPQSPSDEAAAAAALQSFAKLCSVGLGQADDAQSVDSLATNAGLVQADYRSV
jgi:hypothetical protein